MTELKARSPTARTWIRAGGEVEWAVCEDFVARRMIEGHTAERETVEDSRRDTLVLQTQHSWQAPDMAWKVEGVLDLWAADIPGVAVRPAAVASAWGPSKGLAQPWASVLDGLPRHSGMSVEVGDTGVGGTLDWDCG